MHVDGRPRYHILLLSFCTVFFFYEHGSKGLLGCSITSHDLRPLHGAARKKHMGVHVTER